MDLNIIEIIGSILTPLATIIIAIISNIKEGAHRVHVPVKNIFRWLFLLLFWVIAFSATAIIIEWMYWDILLNSSILAISALSIILALAFPISSYLAAMFSSTVMMITFYILIYIGMLKYGALFQNTVRPFDSELFIFIIGIVLITVILVWNITKWRLKATGTQKPPKKDETKLAHDLSRLTELYENGALTKKEFEQAKRKLLSDD